MSDASSGSEAATIRTLTLALAALLAIPALAAGLDESEYPGFEVGTLSATTPSGENALMETLTFSLDYPLRHAEDARKEASRQYLEARLDALGFDVHRHNYPGGANIVGVLPGATRPGEWMVVSAHYDTYVATVHGTWDDGAGVGAALEIGRVAAAQSWDRTLAVVFFDDEELGLVGSGHFASAYHDRNVPAFGNAHVKVVSAISMDPPGLNWPCVGTVNGNTDATLPLSYFQAYSGGLGDAYLRAYFEQAAAAAGVPASAMQFTGNGIMLARLGGAGLGGTSDNAALGARGAPDIWIGGAAHARTQNPLTAQAMTYPLHTPADNPTTLLARCPGVDPASGRLLLALGFDTVVRSVLGTLERVDAHAGAFPTP